MIVKRMWGAAVLIALLGGIKYLFDLVEKSRRPKN